MEKLKTAAMIIAFVGLLFPNATEATRPLEKRLMPENIAVIDNGIKYIPSSRYNPKKGRIFFIEAWSVETKEKLWEKKVYEIQYDLKLEQDVQDRFITSLYVEKGKLIISVENGEQYELDLGTKIVSKRQAP